MRDDHLISICFAGGMKGHAVAAIINMSPEVVDQMGNSGVISRYGDAHMVGVRYGMTSSPPFDTVSLYPETAALDLGRYFDFMQPLAPGVRDHFMDNLPRTSIWTNLGNVPFLETLENKRIVVADHISVETQVSLFPRSRCIALVGNHSRAMRLWSDKYLLLSGHHGNISNLDHTLVRSGLDPASCSRSDTKRVLAMLLRRHVLLSAANASHPRAIVVNVDRLFNPATAQKTYEKMCRLTKITPVWYKAHRFIHEYNLHQDQRSLVQR